MAAQLHGCRSSHVPIIRSEPAGEGAARGLRMKETQMYGPRTMLGPHSESERPRSPRGVLYVHSAPSALRPRIEWAGGGVLGAAVTPAWIPQPAQSGTY